MEASAPFVFLHPFIYSSVSLISIICQWGQINELQRSLKPKKLILSGGSSVFFFFCSMAHQSEILGWDGFVWDNSDMERAG